MQGRGGCRSWLQKKRAEGMSHGAARLQLLHCSDLKEGPKGLHKG